ncbi:hypothetical protein L218DRAFT_953006 [Marasmius fiardii PR-910]|nr:hypothetical protein L218DRAFT_953006 [Marasmius fiardii PR-910]
MRFAVITFVLSAITFTAVSANPVENSGLPPSMFSCNNDKDCRIWRYLGKTKCCKSLNGPICVKLPDGAVC